MIFISKNKRFILMKSDRNLFSVNAGAAASNAKQQTAPVKMCVCHHLVNSSKFLPEITQMVAGFPRYFSKKFEDIP